MVLRCTLVVALAGLTGCLSDPGSGADAIDGAVPVIDGAASVIDAAPPDAPVVVGGQSFPPADTALNITAGWAGDLNGDRFDDVVLLSNTGEPGTAGAYVLLGSDEGVPDYHQFMDTGIRDPLAVAGVQLDGSGATDVVVFAVDFGDGIEKETIESYLMAYLAEAGGATPYRATAVENHVTAIRNNWLFPRDPALGADLVAGRFVADATVPGLAVVHERGAFTFSMLEWGEAAFEATAPESLLPSFHATGAHVTPSLTEDDLDDIVVYSDEDDARWMVHLGDSGFLERIVQAGVPGVTYGAPIELSGDAPVDFVGVRESGVQGVPVDNSPSTTGALVDGVTSIDGFGSATDIVAFAASGASDPEIVVSATGCSITGSACLLFLPDAAINTSNNQLVTGQTRRFVALPASFVPRVLLYGDFNGDGEDELLVIDAGGRQECLRVVGAMLLPC